MCFLTRLADTSHVYPVLKAWRKKHSLALSKSTQGSFPEIEFNNVDNGDLFQKHEWRTNDSNAKHHLDIQLKMNEFHFLSIKKSAKITVAYISKLSAYYPARL